MDVAKLAKADESNREEATEHSTAERSKTQFRQHNTTKVKTCILPKNGIQPEHDSL